MLWVGIGIGVLFTLALVFIAFMFWVLRGHWWNW